MKKVIVGIFLILVGIAALLLTVKDPYSEAEKLDELKAKFATLKKSKVDHSKFPELQKDFKNPREVTAACISCHNQRHKEVMASNHWNWERPTYVKGKGILYLGKKNHINNFCIGSHGNEMSCAKCHIGLGLDDKKQIIFTDSTNIDCMVCHDNTGTYAKGDALGGAPAPTVNLKLVAQKPGKPTRDNCGVCHFFGGGGNNVKHGDLEKAQFHTTKDVDVHMGENSENMSCVDCHKTENHMISGKLYTMSSTNNHRVTCEQCHGETPHKEDIINEHTLKVSCQACHIPEYAKVNATKMEWDWSTAGKLKNGEPYVEEDEMGNHAYMSIKGSFKWAKHVKPEYIWFNGTASFVTTCQPIKDTSKPVVLNKLYGSYSDPFSKITPVKVHRARQPYDPGTGLLITPKLYSDKKGEGAFWQDFDWYAAAREGMKESCLPFSGQVTFIRTESYWPLNHMVSEKDKAVSCTECHTRENSRLAALTDFYMPGRDYNKFVDGFGIAAVVMTFFGVITHGSLRIMSKKRRSR
ncbi:MAG TPA: tetrathionate reductase family octaheme c-type cytochrome [Ignavibacteriales bacterium]|nr:tetrathionate reductase family octaheme c-type cytochrome [Ignavibacteriales bacterium]